MCFRGGSCTSNNHYGPADISALLPNAGWLSSHVRPHQREVGPLAGKWAGSGWESPPTPTRPNISDLSPRSWLTSFWHLVQTNGTLSAALLLPFVVVVTIYLFVRWARA